MTTERSPLPAAPTRRRLLPIAATLVMAVAGGALWWQDRGGDLTRGGESLPPLELIGERVGVLLWHSVPDATSYRVEVHDQSGTLLFSATPTDTVTGLPPGFEAPKWSSWWVRAYQGRRAIAVSSKAPFY